MSSSDELSYSDDESEDGYSGTEHESPKKIEEQVIICPMKIWPADKPFQKQGELLALFENGEWIKVQVRLDSEKIEIFKPQETEPWKSVFLKQEDELTEEAVRERGRQYQLRFFPQLEVLPGYARRSRHITNTLFPFHVKCGRCDGCDEQVLDWKHGADELFCKGMLLAASTAADMWEWLLAIRWRENRPVKYQNPRLDPYTTSNIDPHYDMPRVLQTTLFSVLTFTTENEKSAASRSFGLGCMKGAAIHGAEKNFDLILSTHLTNFERVGRNFNNPLSMCLEGNYSPSRVVIAQKLIELGATSVEGNWANDHPIKMLTKPKRITAISSLIGGPVHENDKRLIWTTLIPNRNAIVGKDGSAEWQSRMLKQIETEPDKTSFKNEGEGYRHRDYNEYLTTVDFPPQAQVWLTKLTVLDLEDNFLTRFEDSFYDSIPSIEHLNLKRNCIWRISSRIQNLKKLQKLEIDHNCLDALPSELALMEALEHCTFEENPILNPPKAIWSAGWESVKGFFTDMHTHGVVQNTTVKALVVGLSEAGKTSLINALESKDGRAHPTFRGDRTVGIEQRHLSFPRYEEITSLCKQNFKLKDFHVTLVFGDFDEVGSVTPTCSAKFECGYWGRSGIKLFEKETEPEDDDNYERDGWLEARGEQVWQFTDTSWDEATRVFEGVVLFGDTHRVDSLWGSPGGISHNKWQVKLTFDEGLNITDAAEFKCIDTTANGGDAARYTASLDGKFRRDAKIIYDIDLLMYDFAGQEEYYITHHIFLTERALYVLVFDLYKYDPRKTHEKQVLYWAQAIQHRVPGAKLLIVGTHADRIEEPSERQQKASKALQQLKNWQNRSKTRLNQKMKSNSKRLKELNDLRQERAAKEARVDFELLKQIRKKDLASDQTLTDDDEKTLEKVNEVLADEVFKKSHPKSENTEMAILRGENQGMEKQLKQLIVLPEKIHCVSGANMLGIEKLRNSIQKSVTHIPTLGEEIPISYDHVRNLVANKRMEDQFKCMEVDEYYAMVKSELPDLALTDTVIERATEFLHVIGEVLFYKKHRIVFLNVGYLVDAFKFIIRHDHNEATTYSAEDHSSIDVDMRQFQHYKRMLLEQGRLSSVLLQCLWVAPPTDGLGLRKDESPESNTRFKALVYLLEKFDIAAILEEDDDGDPATIVVPQFLPDTMPSNTPWTAMCPADTVQLHRLFEFPKAHPRGLMPRLQTRLISLQLMSKIWLSKECVIVPFSECLVMCRISRGDRANSDDPNAYSDMSGLQLIVRGNSDRVHRALATLVALVKSLIAEWPAERPTHYVIYNTPSNLQKYFVKYDVLKAEQDNGYEVHSEGLDKIALVDLLGAETYDPEDVAESNDEKRNIQQMSIGADEGEFLDMDAFVDCVSHDRSVQVLQNYRATSQRWLMLVYNEATEDHFAELVFDALTKAGVPCWLRKYAGNFASMDEVHNDGLIHANAVCPILSSAYWNENRTERNNLWQKIIEAKVPVLPIFAEDMSRPFSGVFGDAFESGMVTQPVVLPDIGSVVPNGVDDMRVLDLIARISDNNLLKKLAQPFSGEGHEDRLKVVRRLSVKTDFTSALGDVPDLTLSQLFSEVLHFPQAVTNEYLDLFSKQTTNTNSDEVLYYDDEALMGIGVANRTNRIKIMDWIQRTKTMRAHGQPVEKANSGVKLQMTDSIEPPKIDSFHWVCFSFKSSSPQLIEGIVTELEKIGVPKTKCFFSSNSKLEASQWLAACMSASVVPCIVNESYLKSATACTEWNNAKGKLLPINIDNIAQLDQVAVNQVNGHIKMYIRGGGSFANREEACSSPQTSLPDIAKEIKEKIIFDRPELALQM